MVEINVQQPSNYLSRLSLVFSTCRALISSLFVSLPLVSCIAQYDDNTDNRPPMDESSVNPTSEAPLINPFLSELSWPLCGRITNDPPTDWAITDGCPTDRFSHIFHDGPLSSTFGPRLLASEALRYDFHRGIDIAAAIGTPVYAVASGSVRRAGHVSGFSDPMVRIRHYDPETANCDTSPCLQSLYLHLLNWVVEEESAVEQGDLIAYTGTSASGFEHLHFEIRQAPGNHDKKSSWQRDAIHPLQFLPLSPISSNETPNNSSADTINSFQLTIVEVDQSNSLRPEISIQVTIDPSNAQLDLNRIEIELYEVLIDESLQRINQSLYRRESITPENTPYDVFPPFLDMSQLNRQYSYKNSELYPWSAFQTFGLYESPFHSELPENYSAHVHLDNAMSSNFQIGQFNGFEITPVRFNANIEQYQLTIRFTQLIGATNLCIQARALNANRQSTPWVSQNCPGK